MSSPSFFRFIERLQHKPAKEKDRIIFITVCVIMLLIIGIWLSFPGEDALEQNAQDQQAGPIRALWQEIKEYAPMLIPHQKAPNVSLRDEWYKTSFRCGIPRNESSKELMPRA